VVSKVPSAGAERCWLPCPKPSDKDGEDKRRTS